MHVLTGFLGSGKTTFLRHLLGEPDFADTAVVINEFGEVGLDHLLVREVSEDAVLLSSGCLCCAVRDDLVSTLADMFEMVRRGEVEPFRRVVVETTGLRDNGWLDVNGSPFTDQARITERFRRVNFGRLEIDITVDDPKAYTRSWTVRVNQRVLPEDELIEFICGENEKDAPHLIE